MKIYSSFAAGEVYVSKCLRCEHRHLSKMVCALDKKPLLPRAVRNKPFCSIGLHDDVVIPTDREVKKLTDAKPLGRLALWWHRIKQHRYASGAVRLGWFVARKCRATDDVIASRRSKCNECTERRRFLGLPTCGICGCFLGAKTAITNQRCPLGKWEGVDGRDEECRVARCGSCGSVTANVTSNITGK